jgi:predicted transcriptional regulator
MTMGGWGSVRGAYPKAIGPTNTPTIDRDHARQNIISRRQKVVRPPPARPVPRTAANSVAQLSRRERQIMDLVYRHAHMTAAEIHEHLPDAPVPAAVRTMLRILEEKGHLRHEKDGPRHVYYPVTPRSVAQRSAVRHLVGTFFNGSRAAAVAALLEESDRPLSSEEREQITGAIKRLRDEGR